MDVVVLEEQFAKTKELFQLAQVRVADNVVETDVLKAYLFNILLEICII